MKSRYLLKCLPPSVNAIWRVSKSKKVYRTSDYMTWSNGEGWNIRSQMPGQHKWTGPVYITGRFKRPNKNSDLDNRLKGIADLLQSAGIIDNDKKIVGWNVAWSDNVPAGYAGEIIISEGVSPAEAA